MRNNFRVEGLTVILEVERKGELLEVLISATDFNKVSELDRKISVNKAGYAVYNKDNKTFLLHRFLLDFPESLQVDHIDANKLNNVRGNLRKVTNKENCMNLNNKYNIGVSGSKGVVVHSKRKGKPYQVRIRAKSYGYYPTIEEASKVANDIYNNMK